jgi:hypothetical protein
MGTRLHYKGTEREKIDIERRMRKATVTANKKITPTSFTKITGN